MSNQSNSELYERAREMCEYHVGTMWERLLQRDMDDNDLESLRYHLSKAESVRAMNEDYPIVEMPDMTPFGAYGAATVKFNRQANECE